jgi:hypothetical protein
MTPDEQGMIQDLFQRLSAQGRVAKDAQADRLINDAVRSNPDAAYMLVQTALVYEHQMNEQEQRIRDLEDQIAQLQRSTASAPAGGGSFLGGRIGAGRGAVPSVPAQSSSPWGNTSASQQPQAYQPPVQQRGGMFGGGQAPMAPQAAAPAGGGFLRSALTTAAGVAGGMMVANSLSGLFGGGNQAHAAGHSQNDNAGALADADRSQDELQDAAYQSEEPAASDLGGWDDVET